MRYRFRTLLIVLAVSVGFGLAIAAVAMVREQGEMIRDAYCLDWASAAIVQHMNDNHGRYPADWNDLRPAFDKVTASDRSFSFEEVQARVLIDFDIDPSAMRDSTGRLLWLRSGRKVSWSSPEPNDRIRSHLQSSAQQRPPSALIGLIQLVVLRSAKERAFRGAKGDTTPDQPRPVVGAL